MYLLLVALAFVEKFVNSLSLKMSLNHLVSPSDPVGLQLNPRFASLNVGTLTVSNGASSGYVLTSDSKGVATWQAPSVSPLLSVTMNLSQAQIQGMHTTPVQVIPADSQGRTIIVNQAILSYSDFKDANPYGGGGNIFVCYSTSNPASGNIDPTVLSSADGSSVAAAMGEFNAIGHNGIGAPVLITNSTAAFTGGSSSPTAVTLTVLYSVIPITS